MISCKKYLISSLFPIIMLLPVAHVLGGNDYENEWKKVATYENQGLPASAKQIVEDIYHLAKAEGNAPQKIKAIIYLSRYSQELDEESVQKIIQLFQNEINDSEAPERNITESLLAEIYWQYYTENRYTFIDRTSLDGGPRGEDITTWDLPGIAAASMELFLSSVYTDATILQRTSVEQYKEILTPSDKASQILRPSLFDLLAHRAIEFLSNDEVYITKAAEQFEITDTAAFETGSAFVRHTFVHSDSSNGQLAALKIYQQLTSFHQQDPYPDALLELHLQRLSYVYLHCSLPEKDRLYDSALLNLVSQFGKTDAVASVYYTIAEQKAQQGEQYHALRYPENRFYLAEANNICNEVIQRFPNTRGSENCKALASRISAKELNIEAEGENSIQKPFRLSVQWKNVDTIWFRTYRVTTLMKESFTQKSPKIVLQEIISTTPLQTWEQILPFDSSDFQRHRTEIAVGGLPAGTYIIIASTSREFISEAQQLSYAQIQITDISYTQYAHPNGDHELYILNRNTGLPIAKARLETQIVEYDYDERKYVHRNDAVYTSDKKGFVRISGIKNGSLSFTIIKGKDTLSTTERLYFREPYNYTDSPNILESFLFTDRAIYRPGQSVYCKGIVLNKKDRGRQQSAAANIKSAIQLYDANWQLISQQEVVTNEYGSYQTVFQIPQGLLTGSYTIQDGWSSRSFYVEEYKRPTFEVLTDPVSGQFGLEDTVTVHGKAIAYTGAAISSGTVNYRVVRNTIYTYYGKWYWPYPTEEEAEIIQGSTTTNEQGQYQFDFVTHSGKVNHQEVKPYFTYTAYIDVTDVSGETRSTSYRLSAGEIGLLLDLQVAANGIIGDSLKVNVQATNLNGIAEKTDIIITVYPLQAPDRLYRHSYWEASDLFALSKEEYNQLFPMDAYAGEADPNNWAFGQEVSRFLLKEKQSIHISTNDWHPGIYKIIVSAPDKNGVEVRNEKIITISRRENAPPVQSYLYAPLTSFIAEPGEQVNLQIATPYGNGYAHFALYRGNDLISSQWFNISSKYTNIPVNITEADRGGLGAQVTMVKDGRYHELAYNIAVPWTNKALKMELITFRNSALPGSEETWQLKITGPDGAAADAELLATLYDASLESFAPHWWSFTNYPINYSSVTWRAGSCFSPTRFNQTGEDWNVYFPGNVLQYASINWFGFYFSQQRAFYKLSMAAESADGDMVSDAPEESDVYPEKKINESSIDKNIIPALRTNLRETAFFYPQIYGDSNGIYTLSFTLPEALTRWKMLTLAHTKSVESGLLQAEMVTKKELMVTPNLPRFFREGDTIQLAARIANLSDSILEGNAFFQLADALTGAAISPETIHIDGPQNFRISPGGNTSVSWQIIIPQNLSALTCTFSASANGHIDGEVHTLPVLSNRLLITESLPLQVEWGKQKDYVFESLRQSGVSKTLENVQLKVEMSPNPAWYAVKTLPYLMEFPYECTEQLFNRYYANSLATYIANSSPRLQQVFEQWKGNQESLLSNLEKNQDLKSALLEESPWVLDAQDETERNRRVGLLFDLNRMKSEQDAVLNKLIKAQSPNGGFSWFPGMQDDPIITNYLLAGWAHLAKISAVKPTNRLAIDVIPAALKYSDQRMNEWYADLEKHKTDLTTYQPGYHIIQYLYMRSYFSDTEMDSLTKANSSYFTGQIKKFWTKYDLQSQGMIAMTFLSQNDRGSAEAIVRSLKERAIRSEEMGMYWKQNRSGYFWWEAPVETQSIMIELFHDMGYQADADALRWWLLRQKQTNNWESTKATAEACYALLLNGSNWLDNTGTVEVSLGGQKLPASTAEAGTGYFHVVKSGNEVETAMADIHLDASSMGEGDRGQAWGAVYWQYLEDLDKVKQSHESETPLNIRQEIYLKVNTNTGQQLVALDGQQSLKVGDLAVIRLVIENDRALEYVHIKGVRASCFEPIDVLSGYHWQDGIGYYMSTKDAATHFFINHMDKGKYVMEYEVRVTQAGSFSGGISTIQCMYAPEFTGHSAGKRITVE